MNMIRKINEKREYHLLDLIKIISAILVISIHLLPFKDINSGFSIWFTNTICRIAVPVFFLSSGFFIESKLNSKKKICNYVIRLSKLYLLYSLIYLPQILNQSYQSGKGIVLSILIIVRDFLFTGSYPVLWYFVSLIYSVLLLYYFDRKKIKKTKIICAFFVLYLCGILFDIVYYNKINIPILTQVIDNYYMYFDNTRNFIFFGFIYFFMGFLINKNKKKLNRYKKVYPFLIVISFIMMYFEIKSIECFFGTYFPIDKNLGLLLLSIFLFLSLIFSNFKFINKHNSYVLRNISTLFYGLHMFINFYFLFFIEYVFNATLNSCIHFLLVLIILFFISTLILYLSKSKFPVLRNFY